MGIKVFLQDMRDMISLIHKIIERGVEKIEEEIPEEEAVELKVSKDEIITPEVPEKEKIEEEISSTTESKPSKKGSIIADNFFGIISIILGVLAYISIFNIFIYTAVINICLCGILIGMMGTKCDRKSFLSYIAVILCLMVLFNLIIIMNLFLIELAEE